MSKACPVSLTAHQTQSGSLWWVYRSTCWSPLLRLEFPLQPTIRKAVTFKQYWCSCTRSLKAKDTTIDYSLLFDFYLPLFIGLIRFEWYNNIADDVLDCKEFLLRTKLPKKLLFRLELLRTSKYFYHILPYCQFCPLV